MNGEVEPVFLAIPQSAIDWLNERKPTQDLISTLIGRGDLKPLLDADFVERGLIISYDVATQLLILWHSDYLEPTRDEPWALLRLASPHGLASSPDLRDIAFRRALQLASRRLKNLLIDSEWEGRYHDNEAWTIILKRGGNNVFSQHLGYVEREMTISGLRKIKIIVVVGPENRWEDVCKQAIKDAKDSDRFLIFATQLVRGTGRKRRTVSEAVNSFEGLRESLRPIRSDQLPFRDLSFRADKVHFTKHESEMTQGWSYDQWIDSGMLSPEQQRVLDKNAIVSHPVRILGPAGTGKTLLMQLLALKQFSKLGKSSWPTVLYVTHNDAMAKSVSSRFRVLGAAEYMETKNSFGVSCLKIATLTDFALEMLSTDLDGGSLISRDAETAKQWQLDQIRESITFCGRAFEAQAQRSALLSRVITNNAARDLFARLLQIEISSAIKGHGLTNDRERYVSSPTALSRLHGSLTELDKGFVFNVFMRYQHILRDENDAVDPDDVALDLLSRLRNAAWSLNRRRRGFDFVFVDETQLFNENERRVFPLLTRTNSKSAPIALALDEAQELYGQKSAGFGALGLDEIEVEKLTLNHRSTRKIVDLAFFVIEKTTDLFGPDFPDFTTFVDEASAENENEVPQIARQSFDSTDYGKAIRKVVREIRVKYDSVLVVCHAERYWNTIQNEFSVNDDLNAYFLLERGDPIKGKKQVVVSRPEYIGNQEFDAVVLIGLEEGITPPRILDNEALSAALYQQSLREIYLAITRARTQVIIMLEKNATLAGVLVEAVERDLLQGRISPD